MRKFKVTKKWPGGPEVGTVYETDNGKVYPFINGDGWRVMGFAISIEELEGFMEEIKEPEEFWVLELDGKVYDQERIKPEDRSDVPDWLRFPTKEHAQAFADWMKDTYVHGTFCARGNTPMTSEQDQKAKEALNSRKHD